MALVWLSLAVAVVTTIASLVFATRRGLESFRTLKRLGRAVSEAAARVEATAARIEEHLANAAESGTKLDAELEQLRRSRAQLNVLTSAIDEVRDSFGRVTEVYPRK